VKSLFGFAFDMVTAVRVYAHEFVVKPIGHLFDGAAADFGSDDD
jgi:hypothetical protein